MAEPGALALGVLAGVLNKKAEAFVFQKCSFQVSDDARISEPAERRTIGRDPPIEECLRFFDHTFFQHPAAPSLDSPPQFFPAGIEADKLQGEGGVSPGEAMFAMPHRNRFSGYLIHFECSDQPLDIIRRDFRRRFGIDSGKFRMQSFPSEFFGFFLQSGSHVRTGWRKVRQAFAQRFEIESCSPDENRRFLPRLDSVDFFRRPPHKIRGRERLVWLEEIHEMIGNSINVIRGTWYERLRITDHGPRALWLCSSYAEMFVDLPGVDGDDFRILFAGQTQPKLRFARSRRTDDGEILLRQVKFFGSGG